MGDRLETIKKKHYSESVGSERGVGEDDVDWLIEQVEKYEKVRVKLIEHTINKNYEALIKLADS